VADRFPSLESLRFFEASARHGNFSRAAGELGVTPAAVSLRIRNLELDLKTRLFTRAGPRISLTRAGAELAGRMGEILTLTRSAVEACRASTTPLRVTATPTFARRWLGPRLSKYQAQKGAVAIHLDVSTDLRASNQFDVAIRSGLGPWDELVSVPLFPILRTPMLSPALMNGKVVSSPVELLDFPFIPDANWNRWFAEMGVGKPSLDFSPVEFQTQDMEALAAVEGDGVALISPLFFQDLLAEGRLIQPFCHVMRGNDHYFVLRHAADSRAEVDHFVRWLCEEAEVSTAAGLTTGRKNMNGVIRKHAQASLTSMKANSMEAA
jgi:LysR family glycine cleavage system transcriptional activator